MTMLQKHFARAKTWSETVEQEVYPEAIEKIADRIMNDLQGSIPGYTRVDAVKDAAEIASAFMIEEDKF